jgi:hypothetical protein
VTESAAEGPSVLVALGRGHRAGVQAIEQPEGERYSVVVPFLPWQRIRASAKGENSGLERTLQGRPILTEFPSAAISLDDFSS